jgi:hypothetical protein
MSGSFSRSPTLSSPDIEPQNILPALVEQLLDKTTLCYREGSSDKVHQCAIESAGTRLVVNFSDGRRASSLNTGTKTNVPVALG